MKHVLNRRRPNRILNGESMRSISSPEANHRVWRRERAVPGPLIAAVVINKIVDHAIETRPVRAVVSIRRLRAGNRDMRVGISFNRSITRRLISPRKRDLHERAVIGPGSEVPAFPRFFRGVRNDRIPAGKVCAPLVVERSKSSVLLSQPDTNLLERVWIPIEVNSIAIRRQRAFVADEVIIHVVTRLVASGGANNVSQTLQNGRIVE